MQYDVSQIHKARRKTLQYDEELRQVEQEITLLLVTFTFKLPRNII